jgi:hypothetical protein
VDDQEPCTIDELLDNTFLFKIRITYQGVDYDSHDFVTRKEAEEYVDIVRESEIVDKVKIIHSKTLRAKE